MVLKFNKIHINIDRSSQNIFLRSIPRSITCYGTPGASNLAWRGIEALQPLGLSSNFSLILFNTSPTDVSVDSNTSLPVCLWCGEVEMPGQ